jgi:hypothetical protein
MRTAQHDTPSRNHGRRLSDIQRDVALRTFRHMLMVWKETVEASHKKNKVTITET